MTPKERRAYAARARAMISNLAACIDALEDVDANGEANVEHVRAWLDRVTRKSERASDSLRWLQLIDLVRKASELTECGLDAATAAQRACARLAYSDPDFAAKIPAREIAALLPLWRARHQNAAGRRRTTFDGALARLGATAGLPSVSEDALRKRRERDGRPA